jgi:dolichyl-diphosphooligosaccharide--protein glycosyltransferase
MTKIPRFTFSLNAEFLLALILVIFTTVSIRLTEFPLWQNDSLMVNGEHLMATHDAYTWLAGAKGVGNFVDEVFTDILAFTASIGGASLSAIGFWSPILFVPLLAIPICLLARFLGLTEGALVFGILASSGVGYLVRTRLGFADTDVISLLFPVSMTCALVVWIEAMISKCGREVSDSSALKFQPATSIIFALSVGLLGMASVVVYPSNRT